MTSTPHLKQRLSLSQSDTDGDTDVWFERARPPGTRLDPGFRRTDRLGPTDPTNYGFWNPAVSWALEQEGRILVLMFCCWGPVRRRGLSFSCLVSIPSKRMRLDRILDLEAPGLVDHSPAFYIAFQKDLK